MSKKIDHSARAHAVLSASSSSRWLKCPPSAVAATMYPSTGTEFTREGTLAHEVAEAVVRAYINGRDISNIHTPKAVTTEMVQCAYAYNDYIQELITDENAVVLLEQRLDFSPWVPDGFGTADCIIIQGHRLDVVDYKFGKGVTVSAEDNSPMMLYGLGALNEFGDIYEIHEVGTHILQPRLNNISSEVLEVEALRFWGDRVVKPVAELAAQGKGDYCSGEHCRFCPHAGQCPTLSADCMKVVNLGGGKAAVPTMAPWMIADILKQESMVSGWLKAVKERALSQMLSGEEIPGFKVVEGRGSREWRSDDEVEAFMESSGFSPEQYTETKILSPYQMEKSIGKKRAAELLADFIVTKPGNPTIAPATDKRQPYSQQEASRKAFE